MRPLSRPSPNPRLSPIPAPSLSPACTQHLDRLRRLYATQKAIPTMEELAPALGLAGKSGAHRVLHNLQRAGYLAQGSGKRLVPTERFFERPVLGPVRAGLAQPVQADPEPVLMSVEHFLVDDPANTSFCRVKGDSMKDAGLVEGDLVVTVHGAKAKPGDIVVAVVDGDITVKFLRRDDLGMYLEPANAAYPIIWPAGELEILGVVTGSFRRFRPSAKARA
jgi:SOS-response transcriptional repressor LexA